MLNRERLRGDFRRWTSALTRGEVSGRELLSQLPRRFGGTETRSWSLPKKTSEHLRLVSLNMAHGRRRVPHQALLHRRAMMRNLERIAGTLGDLEADVLGLQEADGPSSWSGNFDHVATLAELASFESYYRGDHNPFGSRFFQLASGTALLSRRPLLNPRSVPFARNWRDTKGFVVATIEVPAWNGLEIDVVSAHLDFLAPSVRHRQIQHMIESLRQRGRPMILVGDFNCCWRKGRGALELITRSLGLRACDPETGEPTYPSTWPRRRIDWILISESLDFARHHTLPTPLSDHRALVADLTCRA